MKSVHQILNCNSYFERPVEIELANCPIKKGKFKGKETKMRVYSMKNILHDVTDKTLAYINNFFKKCNTLFTKPVKKIIHPGEIQEKENIIRAAKHNIEQQ